MRTRIDGRDERTLGEGRRAGSARRFTVYAWRTALAALAVVSTLGCDPAVSMMDGGVPPDSDAAAGGTGTVVFRFEAREEETPGEWEVESVYVGLAELRADNDRGGALEPVWERPGRVRLDEDPPERRVAGVPATYGGVTLRSLESGEPTLELTLGDGETRVRVESRRAYERAVRCEEGGVSLRPAGEVTLRLDLDAASLADVLDGEELPEPSDGVVEIDESSEPELLARVEAALGGAWHLDCEAL